MPVIGHTEIIPPISTQATLPELAKECCELLKVRHEMGVALAVRLAIAKKIITSGQSKERNFTAWCRANIVKPDGKPYGITAIHKWVRIGNQPNPTIALERDRAEKRRYMSRYYKENGAAAVIALRALRESVVTGRVVHLPPKKRKGLPAAVANEVNELMTAWEQASPQSRTQFLYMIGANIAARAERG